MTLSSSSCLWLASRKLWSPTRMCEWFRVRLQFFSPSLAVYLSQSWRTKQLTTPANSSARLYRETMLPKSYLKTRNSTSCWMWSRGKRCHPSSIKQTCSEAYSTTLIGCADRRTRSSNTQRSKNSLRASSPWFSSARVSNSSRIRQKIIKARVKRQLIRWGRAVGQLHHRSNHLVRKKQIESFATIYIPSNKA